MDTAQTTLGLQQERDSRVPCSAGFGIIYCDPAWSYNDKCHAGKRGAGYKYTTTSTEDMSRLPVIKIAAKDCALFMWATMPMLPDALVLMKAWGFQYKTVTFVWVKTNKKADTDFFGMGNWTRANAEVCLLGIRGKPKRVSAAVRQVIRRPIMRHSEKPPEVRERIVTLMGDIPRVELFARVKTEGWSVWGNEVTSDVAMMPNSAIHAESLDELKRLK